MATTTCLILPQHPNLLPLQEMAVDDISKVGQVEIFWVILDYFLCFTSHSSCLILSTPPSEYI